MMTYQRSTNKPQIEHERFICTRETDMMFLILQHVTTRHIQIKVCSFAILPVPLIVSLSFCYQFLISFPYETLPHSPKIRPQRQ
jgi:hypothetical protein